MKLVRFVSPGSEEPEFGGVIGTSVVAFSALQEKSNIIFGFLGDSRAYLENLPESEYAARTLLEWGEQHPQELGNEQVFDLDAVTRRLPLGQHVLRQPSPVGSSVRKPFRPLQPICLNFLSCTFLPFRWPCKFQLDPPRMHMLFQGTQSLYTALQYLLRIADRP